MRNPRQLAVEALLAAERGGYSNLVLDRMLQSASLSRADEAFFTALFYGTVERLPTLETILNRYASLPAAKMKPEIRAALYTALYQILFLDKVPASAAVNEAVQLVKSGRHKQLGGFVNAVLRATVRDREQLSAELQQTEDLSFKYACSPSLAAELSSQYGRAAAEAFLADAFHQPPVFIRKNTLLAQDFAQPENYRPTDLPQCYTVLDAQQALHSDDFQQGRFHVEDKACQLACKILDPRPGERVLDVCAAPGGKTFTMAQYMQNSGEILACDLHPHRLRLIEAGAKRLHISVIRTMENDARQHRLEWGTFDKILCDVPCSGYGVIRRKPEIKLKDTDQFAALPEVQLQILTASAQYLKKGGFLLYSTCTVRECENDSVVQRFINGHSDYKMVTKRQLMPQTDGTDGFFYCLLTR